jgi:hypothetical protein
MRHASRFCDAPCPQQSEFTAPEGEASWKTSPTPGRKRLSLYPSRDILLERLSQDLEDAALELGRLIQQQAEVTQER